MFKSTHWASKNCPLLKRTVQVPIFIVLFFKLTEYCGTPQYNQILANTLKLVLFRYYFLKIERKETCGEVKIQQKSKLQIQRQH